MASKNKYGLSDADVNRVINELIQDEKITSAIEKIVMRRLKKQPHASQEWRQSVVDSTVIEILQKLNIVDMILEEQQIAGYSDGYRPSFSESEPQQSRSSHPRRRAREINKAAGREEAKHQSSTDLYKEEEPEDTGDINLDRTQVLTVTLPSAVKEMPGPMSSDSRLQSFHPEICEFSDGEEENSHAYNSSINIISMERSGQQEQGQRDSRSSSSSDSRSREESDGSPDVYMQSAEEDMRDDSVEFYRESNQSEEGDSSEHKSNGSPISVNSGEPEFEQEGQNSSVRDSLEHGMIAPVEISGEGDIIAASTETKDFSDDIIQKDSHDLPSVLNESAKSIDPEYAEEDWEEPPSTENVNAKSVKFADDLVSDVFLSRYKYDRDEVADMFYTADDGTKFQMDFDRELDRSMNAEKGWLEWMMERTDDEALRHEKEDEEYHSYEYELDDEYSDGETPDEYF